MYISEKEQSDRERDRQAQTERDMQEIKIQARI